MKLPAWEEIEERLPPKPVLIGWVVLAAVLLYSYASDLADLVQIWWDQPEYGHGFFVPPFAVLLLYLRRDMFGKGRAGGYLWAIPFLAAWAAMRWTSAWFFFQLLDPFSLLPLMAGLTVFVGGTRALRWAWPTILFLGFMVPLPGAVSTAMSAPLQRIGTGITVYTIQTLSIPAAREGNLIHLPEGELNVVEACSGLRMLMLFFAVCVGAAFIIRRPRWEKVVIVGSAVPIAIFANVMRLTITAIAYQLAHQWSMGTETIDEYAHDFAGWFMMPLAMLVLWGEMTLIAKLQIEATPSRALSLTGSLAAGARKTNRPAAAGRPKRP
jgi:exosortase